MRSLDCSQPANDLTRRDVLVLAAIGIMPALRSASATGQKEKSQDPAKNTLPSRIFAEVDGFGPEKKRGIIAITPADGSWRWVEPMRGLARLSPDGHTLAFLGPINPPGPRAIWTRDIRGEDPPRRISELTGIPVWSPDGKWIVTSPRAPGAGEKLSPRETWRMNADGSNQVRLPVPETDWVVDWSPDGRWLLTESFQGPEGTQIRIMHPDGTGLRSLTESKQVHHYPRFSPDGRRIVCSTSTPKGHALWIVGVDGRDRREIPLEPRRHAKACWSPDGRWLAIELLDLQPSENGRLVLTSDLDQLNSRIEVVSVGGEDRRRLNLPKGYIVLCDWR
jgi:Tol biopolymer transport system component